MLALEEDLEVRDSVVFRQCCGSQELHIVRRKTGLEIGRGEAWVGRIWIYLAMGAFPATNQKRIATWLLALEGCFASLRQSPTVHLVGADGVGDQSFSFITGDRKSCASLVSKPSWRLGAEQLGCDAIGFFLETGTYPGKELKTNCHFAVGARGVLCSYQAVCCGLFG